MPTSDAQTLAAGLAAAASFVCLTLPAVSFAEVVELRRSAKVYAQPQSKEKLVSGVVKRGTRVAVQETLDGSRASGCRARWLKIDSDAWLCSTTARAVDAAPGGEALPVVKPGRLLPHRYALTRSAIAYASVEDALADRGGRALSGEFGLRTLAIENRAGRTFVRTSRGWLERSKVRMSNPSPFVGIPIKDNLKTRRLGFVVADSAPLVDGLGRATGTTLPRLSAFSAPLGPGIRINGSLIWSFSNTNGITYVRDDDIVFVDVAERPASVGEDERWLDISLAKQLLVAYEGDRPVYATLVSTARTATPEGLFTIKKKRGVVPMRSTAKYNNEYHLDTPWVMTLEGRIAMHAAYWHDEFGTARSHGCVNLSPADARYLWEFTAPSMPPGWLRRDETETNAGTTVRIRR